MDHECKPLFSKLCSGWNARREAMDAPGIDTLAVTARSALVSPTGPRIGALIAPLPPAAAAAAAAASCAQW